MDKSSCLGGGLAADAAKDVVTIQCLEPLFISLVNTVIALSGVALFIMIIFAGYNFLFSGGDPKKLEQAKGGLTFAIIGLVIISSAYLILNTIAVFTGASDITKFDVFSADSPGQKSKTP